MKSLFDFLSIPQTTHFLSCLTNPSSSNAKFAAAVSILSQIQMLILLWPNWPNNWRNSIAAWRGHKIWKGKEQKRERMIFKRGFKVNTCSFLNKIRTWWYDWWLKFSENFQKATPPFDTIGIEVDFAQISPNRLYVPLLKVWRTLRRLFSQVLGGKTQKQFSASKRKQVKHPEKTNDEGHCHDIKN